MNIGQIFTWVGVALLALWVIFHLSAASGGRDREPSTTGQLVSAGFLCLALGVIDFWLLWMNNTISFNISIFLTWVAIGVLAFWIIFHLSAAFSRGRKQGVTERLITAGFSCLVHSQEALSGIDK